MGAARPLHNADVVARSRERVVRLERICDRLRGRVQDERRRADAAEKNARAFHAQLLRARVAALPKRQPEGE